MRRAPLFFWIAALMIAMPAFAQETAPEEPSTAVEYSPAPCEFTITFPDAPYKTTRCAPAQNDTPEGGVPEEVTEPNKESCTEQASFTQVYDMSSSVNVRVTCSAVDENIKANYSPEVMEDTLRLMAAATSIQTSETNSDETEHFKQATLVGEGVSGLTPMVFIAQLWIGEKSAMSVEAELTGEASKDADTLFSDILKSIRYKEN